MASIFEDLADLSGQIGRLTMLPVFDGTYSKVYQGEYAGQTVAVKVLKLIGRIHTMRRKIHRERVIWKALNHPNILPLVGYAEGDAHFEPFGALVSPWCTNGDAAKFLAEHGPSLSLDQRITLWEGVVQGVNYLHSFDPIVVHGDLKPANILLDSYGNPRICDFGLARLNLEEGGSGMTTTSAHTGTERYLAYELVTSDDIAMPTMASDIHALGCIGLDFIFLQLPYSHRRNNARGHIFYDIRQRLPPAAHPGNLSNLEEVFWNIIARCWSLDPAERPVTGALLTDLHAAISPQIWTTVLDDTVYMEIHDIDRGDTALPQVPDLSDAFVDAANDRENSAGGRSRFNEQLDFEALQNQGDLTPSGDHPLSDSSSHMSWSIQAGGQHPVDQFSISGTGSVTMGSNVVNNQVSSAIIQTLPSHVFWGSKFPEKGRRRQYLCDWKGCTRLFGTLDDLNDHVMLQSHGPKRRAVAIGPRFRCNWEGCKKVYSYLPDLNEHVIWSGHGPLRNLSVYKKLIQAEAVWMTIRHSAQDAPVNFQASLRSSAQTNNVPENAS